MDSDFKLRKCQIIQENSCQDYFLVLAVSQRNILSSAITIDKITLGGGIIFSETFGQYIRQFWNAAYVARSAVPVS